MVSPSPSNDPNQWFDENEDDEHDGDFEPGVTPKSEAASSSSDSDTSDGESSDPEAELSPQEVASLVREAASLPAGKRQVPCKGKMYSLSPPGQGKKPMRPVFINKLPEECEQLGELFFTGGRRYYRPLLDGDSIRFNVVSVKTIRSVVTSMLSEMPDDDRDIRVFCQEHTSEDVFKHLLGIEEPPPAEKTTCAPAEGAVAEAPKEAGAAEPVAPAEQEKEKKQPPKTEKTKKEPAPKRKAPAAGGAAGKKRQKVPSGQRTLDSAVVVVDSPVRSQLVSPEAAAAQPGPARAVQPAPSARAVAQIIRGKLTEIAYLLDFLEKEEHTAETSRQMGL